MKAGIRAWLCWIGHKWKSKRIQRIASVRVVRRCARCGWLEVDREPTIPVGSAAQPEEPYQNTA